MVAMLTLACHMILRAARNQVENIPRIGRVIVGYVVRFISSTLARWIASNGGWVSNTYVKLNFTCNF